MRFVLPAWRERATARRGQTLVEFAIILPFLVLIFSAIVDFGFLFYDHVSTQAACREGARCMIQANAAGAAVYTGPQLQVIVQKAHGPFNPILAPEVVVNQYVDDGSEFGNPHKTVRTITISHKHSWIVPVFIPFAPSIQIRSYVKAYLVPGLNRI